MTDPRGLSYGRYRTGNGDEWMMRIGAADARPVLVLPPLFEEMNRTRAFLASLMRSLAGRGFGCWLPDLPGTGESERALEDIRWDDWRQAARDAAAHVAEAAGTEPIVVSVRGGSLLDDVLASCRWRFAPAEGGSLARDLLRTAIVSEATLEAPVVELGGYSISELLLAELREARAADFEAARTVRLESDPRAADLKLPGPALWRRSEPSNAVELAASLADDLSNWAERCAAS